MFLFHRAGLAGAIRESRHPEGAAFVLEDRGLAVQMCLKRSSAQNFSGDLSMPPADRLTSCISWPASCRRLFLLQQEPPGNSRGVPQRVEKVAKATFSREMRARWASIPGGKVGPSCARSVISEAHVPGKDRFSFSSCGCGRRNSARLSFVEGFSTACGTPRLCRGVPIFAACFCWGGAAQPTDRHTDFISPVCAVFHPVCSPMGR